MMARREHLLIWLVFKRERDLAVDRAKKIKEQLLDSFIEQRAFAAGEVVEKATGSAVLGGLVSAGNAVGLSFYETGADFAQSVREFFNAW